MRGVLAGVLLFATVLAGGYFYKTANAVCDAPIAYRIGVLDPDFGLSEDEARSAVSDAESLWEDSTGRNLFTYDGQAEFTINFIYDGRQEFTNTEHELRTQLEEKHNISESIRVQYEALLEKYSALLDNYEAQTDAYNADLRAHNVKVDHWNQQGGAPKNVYDELTEEQRQLEAKQQALRQLAGQLNQIAKEINALGEQGNMLVRTYNNVVTAYNNTFTHEREFTQGDNRGDTINIYQYEDGEELRLVLAHELGHALSLGHVDGETSIMHYLMGGQDFEDGLTAADLTEFAEVCGESSLTLWSARW